MTDMSSASSSSSPTESAISSPVDSASGAISGPPSPKDVFHESQESYFPQEGNDSSADTEFQSSPPTPTASSLSARLDDPIASPGSFIGSTSAYGGDTSPLNTTYDASSANISIVSYLESSFQSYLTERKGAREEGLYGLLSHADRRYHLKSAKTIPETMTDLATEAERYHKETTQSAVGTGAYDRAHFEHGLRESAILKAHMNRVADAGFWLDRDGNIVDPPDSDEEDVDGSEVYKPRQSSRWSSASGMVGAAYATVSSMFRSS